MNTAALPSPYVRAASAWMLAGILTAWFPILAHSQGQNISNKTIQIGIVVDGPWERNKEVITLLEKEVSDVLAEDVGVRFPSDKILEGDWTVEGVRKLNDRLLSDPQLDILIGFGVFTSQDLCLRKALPKPVIAPVVIDPTRQHIPYRDGVSGVKNLNYLMFPETFERDIRQFQEIVPFKHLAIIGSKRYRDGVPSAVLTPAEMGQRLGINIQTIYMDSTADEVLTALSPDAEAVYLEPILHVSSDELGKLIEGINRRRLPSFSFLGESEVKQGIMAALNPDIFPRMNRRIALNIQRIVHGEDPGSLPVAFPAGKRLFVNYKTAMQIGVSPNWGTFLESELIDIDTARAGGTRLTLQSAMRLADRNNLDLKAKEREVAAGEQSVKIGRAALLPQLEASASGSAIDEDRAIAYQPQRSGSTTVGLSQILFSEPAWADISVRSALQKSRESSFDQLRLDVLLNAAVAYLNQLRASKIHFIQMDNLRITRSNLEVAQIRQTSGSAGPAEPLRWEIEIANSKKNVMESYARMVQASLQLGQILNRKSDEVYAPADVSLEDPELLTSRAGFLEYFNTPASFAKLTDFMVQEGLSRSRELQELDALIAAKSRAVTSLEWSHFLPTVSAYGQYTNNFYRGGKNQYPPTALPYDRNDWLFGVRLSLPIFSGFSTVAKTRQAGCELEQLQTERRALFSKLELKIRTEMENVESAYFGIQQSRLASEAAKKNFDIVSEAYFRGSVSIIDLLDAQNAGLLAKQVEVNALFDFLINYMKMQRAVSQFDLLLSPVELDGVVGRLKHFGGGTN